MTVANFISLFRVAVLPILAYLVLQQTASASLWAIFVMILAILSDMLDGYIARWQNKVTNVGSFLDPFADKLLVGGMLLLYAALGVYWISILLIFIVRDVLVVIVRRVSAKQNVLLREWSSQKLFIYFQYAIVMGLLISDFFLYDESLMVLVPVAEGIVVVFTAMALVWGVWSVVYFTLQYLRGRSRHTLRGKEIQKEEMVILANKKATKYHDGYRRHLLRVFAQRRGAPLHFLVPQKNMYEGTRKLVHKAQHIIIAGGDGSFESALNYAPFHQKSLGFFPLGAGNAYYSYFYKGKRFEYLRSRFPFREALLDVVEVEIGGKTFETTFLSMGVDAEVIRLTKERGKQGFVDYFIAGAQAAAGARAQYDFECRVDGKKYHWKNCVNLTLGKVPYYGFTMRSLVGRVNADDGKVYGLACVNTHTPFVNKGLRLWALGLAAFGMEKSPLLSLKGKVITVRSDIPFPVQAGGDFVGETTFLRTRVVRKQKVLVI